MKSKEDIFNDLKVMMNELFEIPAENITMESRFYDDLMLDSIDAIDLIAHLQTVTGERLDPQDFKQVRKVSDVVEAAEKIITRQSFDEKNIIDN